MYDARASMSRVENFSQRAAIIAAATPIIPAQLQLLFCAATATAIIAADAYIIHHRMADTGTHYRVQQPLSHATTIIHCGLSHQDAY